MRRFMLAVAAVAACGLTQAQEKPADPPKETEKEKADREWKEMNKKIEEEWKVYFKTTSELPDLVPTVGKGVGVLEKAEVAKDDPPAVRAAKRAVNAEVERYDLIRLRIENGQFAGAAQYNQLTDCVFGQYASATLAWNDPEKLLPFAERVVICLMRTEEFNFFRVKRGLEEPQLLPQLQAARYRAEVTVLKLREQIKAKKK